MKDLLISLLVFALIFGGALVGMAVRPLLSDHHLHSDSRDVVKLTAGLIGTLTALVLGLLIASAKTTFDQKTNQVRQLTATIILLDDLLAQYGPEAAPLRTLLRQGIPLSVPGHSGFLAWRDFRERYSVCANQSGRDGLAFRLRAVVCRRDFSGSGTG